ncbi:hypothetical protein LTR84_011332 [Exophiala bonariae]|uniref:RTA1 domain protein n=1 Tax=Exophiala bonariae TaxID=1690606 RepID=A0AAV9MUP7_9EURO|nr:hypothetical protein LTR84_011332 [Exophiala bonariae]
MSDPEVECTYATCSVKEQGMIEYIPALPGNIAYAGIFFFILMLQVYFGIRYKTWGFLAGMVCGLSLEIAGYAGRVLLHDNVFEKTNFIIYLVGLTIGPAFLSASIYLCLGRIITIFGTRLSLLKPKIITWIFILADSLSLILQSVGGALTSMADDEASNQQGVDIMIAGLWSQVISLSVFIILCSHFAFNVLRYPLKINPQTVFIRQTIMFKCFLLAIGTATITIMIRSCYRLAELQEGFDGNLANDEVLFMILEGPMIIAAVAVLTICHPGVVMGADMWKSTSFRHNGAEDAVAPYKETDEDDNIAMVPVARYSNTSLGLERTKNWTPA